VLLGDWLNRRAAAKTLALVEEVWAAVDPYRRYRLFLAARALARAAPPPTPMPGPGRRMLC
jgi:hypothetical protein